MTLFIFLKWQVYSFLEDVKNCKNVTFAVDILLFLSYRKTIANNEAVLKYLFFYEVLDVTLWNRMEILEVQCIQTFVMVIAEIVAIWILAPCRIVD